MLNYLYSYFHQIRSPVFELILSLSPFLVFVEAGKRVKRKYWKDADDETIRRSPTKAHKTNHKQTQTEPQGKKKTSFEAHLDNHSIFSVIVISIYGSVVVKRTNFNLPNRKSKETKTISKPANNAQLLMAIIE